jgi:CubicO group peptidase (beta-lactamase class C family)
LLAFLWSAAAFSAPIDAEIDAIIADEMVKQELVGAAVGVVKDGRIIHLKGYGHHAVDRKKAISTSTIFRWASISKTLTSAAAFQLIEAGKVALDDKVSKHCKYWPSKGREGKATLGHMLSNRSGMHHYGQNHKNKVKYAFSSVPYRNKKGRYSGKNSLKCFAKKVSFKPGTDYRYTTFGFNVAGAVIDEAAPKGYERWILNRIAKPLKMKTLTAHTKSIGGYKKTKNGELKKVKEGKVTWKLPGGGWASTIGDLSRFMIGLMGTRILKDPSAMWQDNQNTNGYRYGIQKSGTGDNIRVFHSGAHDDVRTLLYFYPEKKVGVAIMINGAYVSVSRIRKRVLKQLGYGNGNSANPYHPSIGKKGGHKYVGVWQKTGNKVLIRKGYKTDEFNAEWKRLKAEGFQPVDIEAYHRGTKLVWDGVFKAMTGKNAMYRNLTSDQFTKRWKSLSKDGLRLIDVETYRVGLKRKWAGLFVKGSGKYALHRGLSSDAFGDKYKRYLKKGYRLIDIETYTVGVKRKWAGVWVSGKDGLLNRNYEAKEFWDLVETRRQKGYQLIDVERYRVGTKTKYAGVWEKATARTKYAYGQPYTSFADHHKDKEGDGYELVDLERQ